MDDFLGFEEVDTAVSSLREGQVILYPTDTIWGLGCDAENSVAVERIFKLKQRKPEKPMIILVDSMEMLQKYALSADPSLIRANMRSDRPTTLVLDGGQNCSKHLVGADGSVAIRLTNDPLCLSIIGDLGRGVVSTSANLSGQAFDGSFKDISAEILEGVDFAFSARREEETPVAASRLIRLFKNGQSETLRP